MHINLLRVPREKKRCERENHEELYKDNSGGGGAKTETENALENSIKLSMSPTVILLASQTLIRISISWMTREERPRLSGMRVAWVFAFF